jgi:hypothetical protein
MNKKECDSEVKPKWPTLHQDGKRIITLNQDVKFDSNFNPNCSKIF